VTEIETVILNQEPVTKMVDGRELRWFRHLLKMDSNRNPKDRMGRTYADTDKEKREDIAGGD
jgi:hypothetical protein